MRKVKNFIYGVYILFPLLVLLFSLFSDGYQFSENYPANFWTAVSTQRVSYGDILNFIMPLGDFSYNYLSPIFDGNLTFLSESALTVVSWLADYYILLPLVYLVIKIFTFIPTMLIKFMNKIEKENNK